MMAIETYPYLYQVSRNKSGRSGVTVFIFLKKLSYVRDPQL